MRLRIQQDSASYLFAEIITLGVITLLCLGFASFVTAGSAQFEAAVPIDTSLSALPGYALLSLMRSLISLSISLTFAVIFGNLAARSRRNERILIPLLDVLQSLPVLTFLPGFVLTLTMLFQSSRWGLEISCILMIFTGQAWNLVFAYYDSQKQLSPELREVTKLYGLSSRQKFLLLDLPNGMRPLIYNGMMSMAGGWFFLTLCEAYTLDEKSFRLPGLGSYLTVAFETQNTTSFLAGLGALATTIIGVDFLLWRPLIAWVSDFGDGQNSGEPAKQSLFLTMMKRAKLISLLTILFDKIIEGLILGKESRAFNIAQNLFSRSANNHFLNSWTFSSESKPKKLRKNSGFSMRWIASLLGGALLYYALPYLPQFAKSLSLVGKSDWLQLTNAVGYTFLRVICVVIISTAWTLPLGLWVGLNPKVARYAQPIIQNVAAFPAPVLFPIFAMLFMHWQIPAGLSAVLLMTIGNQWYVLFNIISGATAIDREHKTVAQVYGLNLWQKLKLVYLPALFPSIVTGWITAAGGSWNASIVAELVTYPGGVMQAHGIGAEITRATMSGNYALLGAAVIVETVALIIINRTVWRALHQLSEKTYGY